MSVRDRLVSNPAWPPVLAAHAGADSFAALGELRTQIEALLPSTGAVLLRGFAVPASTPSGSSPRALDTSC
jgi:hypothetical protein